MPHLELVPQFEYDDTPSAALIPEMIGFEEEPYNFKTEDILATTIQSIPKLVKMARQAIYLVESHRGFVVATAALAYDTNPEQPRIGVFTSGNYKASLRQEDRDDYDVESISKVCAEMDIEIRPAEAGFKRISAIAIAATEKRYRIAQVTGVPSATLHPCGDCGDVMRRSKIYDKDTVLLTIGTSPESKTMQVQSVQEYQKRYKNVRAGNPFIDADEFIYSPFGWDRKREEYLAAVTPITSAHKKLNEFQKRKIAVDIIRAA